MTASQRRKGADSERALASWLRAMGYADARRTFAGDGRQRGDIAGMGVIIEVKAHAKPRLKSWLRELDRVRRDDPGYLVVHTPGIGDVGAWSVYWHDKVTGDIHQSTVREMWGLFDKPRRYGANI